MEFLSFLKKAGSEVGPSHTVTLNNSVNLPPTDTPALRAAKIIPLFNRFTLKLLRLSLREDVILLTYIYMARCNQQHGHRAPDSERDQKLCVAAGTLVVTVTTSCI